MGIQIKSTIDGEAFFCDSTTDILIGRLWHEDDNDSAEVIAREFLEECKSQNINICELLPAELEEKVKIFHQRRDARINLALEQELSKDWYN